MSLQAPFYPGEAEKKGASPTQYGFVFGIFELTVFIVSPIFGAHLNKIGAKRVFNLGILTTGTCSILFGFLDRIEVRRIISTATNFELIGDGVAGFFIKEVGKKTIECRAIPTNFLLIRRL